MEEGILWFKEAHSFHVDSSIEPGPCWERTSTRTELLSGLDQSGDHIRKRLVVYAFALDTQNRIVSLSLVPSTLERFLRRPGGAFSRRCDVSENHCAPSSMCFLRQKLDFPDAVASPSASSIPRVLPSLCRVSVADLGRTYVCWKEDLPPKPHNKQVDGSFGCSSLELMGPLDLALPRSSSSSLFCGDHPPKPNTNQQIRRSRISLFFFVTKLVLEFSVCVSPTIQVPAWCVCSFSLDDILERRGATLDDTSTEWSDCCGNHELFHHQHQQQPEWVSSSSWPCYSFPWDVPQRVVVEW